MTLGPARWILIASTATALACGSNAPAPASGAAATAKKAAEVANASDAGVSAANAFVYAYAPMGKRDPFRSAIVERAPQEGLGPCSEPLCQWDIDQLRLVAVVTGDATPLAMLEDPQTRGHIIRRGTKVGKQGGQVTQILRDSVTITEFFRTPDGKQAPQAVTVRLKEESAAVTPMNLFNGKGEQ